MKQQTTVATSERLKLSHFVGLSDSLINYVEKALRIELVGAKLY